MSQVYVACKLPNGHVIAMGETAVTLKGYHNADIVTPEGYGLTAVDKSLWDAWYAKHAAAKFQPIVAGLIFAHEKMESVRDESEDRAEVKSGFEGMPQTIEDPEGAIEPEPESAKARKNKAK